MKFTIRIALALMGTLLGVAMLVTPAHARAVQLGEPKVERVHHDPVLYVEHVQRRWYYVELADGSSWMFTPCRQEDSRNCWWNAQTRGNGEGTSFVNIHGHYHYAVRGTVIR
jgi:hypothetical protein